MGFSWGSRGVLRAAFSILISIQGLGYSPIFALLPIMQGYTDEHSAHFVVESPQDLVFRPFVFREPAGDGELELLEKIQSKRFSRNDSQVGLHHYFVEGLNLGERYRLELRSPDGSVVDRRWFKALDPKKRTGRIAFISCMHDLFYRPSIWQSLAAQKPDVVFLLGDGAYVDDPIQYLRSKPTGSLVWRRHAEVRNTLPFFFQSESIPLLAIWDDHDTGLNDADESLKKIGEFRETFIKFFSPDRLHTSLHRGPGLAARYSLFGMDFFFLDGRSFRRGRRSKVAASESRVLGDDQMEWVMAEMQKSKEPSIAWFLKGDQFFGGYRPGDSSENTAPAELKRFREGVRAHHSGPVILVSGDRHYSEVADLGADLFGAPSLEITSSSMHSFLRNPWAYQNPRRVAATPGHNFVVVDFSQESLSGQPTLSLDIRSIGARGNLLFRVKRSFPSGCAGGLASL